MFPSVHGAILLCPQGCHCHFVSGPHGGASKDTNGQMMLGLNTRKQEAALATQRDHALISHRKQWLVYWDFFLSLLRRRKLLFIPHPG